MTQVTREAVEAAKTFTRQFEAVAKIAKALENISSLENSTQEAEAAKVAADALAVQAQEQLDKVLVDVKAAQTALADALAARDAAHVEATQVVEKAAAQGDSIVFSAKQEAEFLVSNTKARIDEEERVHAGQLAAINTEIAVAQAELDRINAALAEVLKKLGA